MIINREKTLLTLIGVACAVAIACLLLPSCSHAGDLTLSYLDNPSPTCADNVSPKSMCPTTGFEISKGLAATGAFTVLESVAPTVLSKRYSNLTPGTYCYFVKTISNSEKSAESNRACADVPSLPPKAPQGMTIKIEVTVTAVP